MEKKNLDFEDVWKRVIEYSGETFFLIGDDPFTYSITGNLLYPSRTDYHMYKNDLKKTLDLSPLKGPGEIRDIIRIPSYVWAILTDKKISEKT